MPGTLLPLDIADVRALCARARVTRRRLAAASGLDESHLSAVLCGLRPLLPPTAKKLAAGLAALGLDRQAIGA
jgi:transcriptional regulator with XRE-family HTH domain